MTIPSLRCRHALIAATARARDRGELDEAALNEAIVVTAADAAAAATGAGITAKIALLTKLSGRAAACDTLVATGVIFDGPWTVRRQHDGLYCTDSGQARLGPFATHQGAVRCASRENAYLATGASDLA